MDDLHQQRIHAMGMNHAFARRPCEDGEAAILRRHQPQRVSLVVDKLRRRQMSRAAMLHGRNDYRLVADDWFS